MLSVCSALAVIYRRTILISTTRTHRSWSYMIYLGQHSFSSEIRIRDAGAATRVLCFLRLSHVNQRVGWQGVLIQTGFQMSQSPDLTLTIHLVLLLEYWKNLG